MGRRVIPLPDDAHPLVLLLRKTIKDRGLSERDVQREAKLSDHSIYRMGFLKNAPRIDTLERAFDVLGWEIYARPKGGE